MTKITLAFAALLAGTTMTSVANADAVRVGFGFPLGSFVAHSNQNYSARDFARPERPRYVRAADQDDAPARKIAKVKRPVVAEAPAVQTAKLESKTESDPATTTVIEKTPVAKSDATPAKTTTASIASAEVKPSVNSENDAAKTDADTATAASKHVCRRYSPAIAALVDVPCE
ncbi:MAG: hypothetical protein QM780_09135 [Hyphomicrobium sp.]|uniref:hypothetical protein n=1 Tax=Hyphomicrobium sp. TaxID=82 RepID=UPI0039E3B9F7